ncbi:uncharacterized protein F5Z01DRAFT_154794 [Emericellopsis atlantica]|uniref:Uncharacterized protein n=1 Tax=Emericellopsis atlantica TaxID=2614577 RepID=A0A9P8CMX4_9HYPO|nr:uncharacterized protein F5Z01DRAFT_154794 [Emericellopsis atlantica]KAG9253169.1 hypothetical protein F5Z01DRAFT_154794 [Emericellopsis atlantica]
MNLDRSFPFWPLLCKFNVPSRSTHRTSLCLSILVTMSTLPGAPTASAYHLHKHDRQLHDTIQRVLSDQSYVVQDMKSTFDLCSDDHQKLVLNVFDELKTILSHVEPKLQSYRQATLDIICTQHAPETVSSETQYQRASEIVECFEHVIELGASLSGTTGDHVRKYLDSKGPLSQLFHEFYRESLIIDEIVASSQSPARHMLTNKSLDAHMFPKTAGHYMIMIVGGPDEPDFFGAYVGQARNLFDRLKKHRERNIHYARERQKAADQGLPLPYSRQMLYNSWNYAQRFVRFAPLHRSYNYMETDDSNKDTLPQTWQSIVESVYAVFFKAVQRDKLEKWHPSPTLDDNSVGLNVQFPLFQRETFDGKFNGGIASLKNNPDPAVQVVYKAHMATFIASGRAAQKSYGYKSTADGI